MADYMSREAAVKVLTSVGMQVSDSRRRVVAKCINEIELLPAADVAPVVHGQWIIGVDDDDFDVKCSKCEWTDIFEVAGIAAVERIAKTMHYCLNCGAKMDGGAEDG